MEQKPRTTAGDTLGWLFGAILIALGAVALVSQVFSFDLSGLVWALIMGGVGAAFFSVALRSPANWWAMIPGYVFIAVAGIIAMDLIGVHGNAMAVFVLTLCGIPFVYVFLRDRRHWWALIPAYVFFAIGGIVGLSKLVHGPLVATYVLFAIAFPFFVTYFANRKNSWALIPAFILSGVAVTVFMASNPFVLPVMLILGGVVLLVVQFGRRDTAAVTPQLPTTGPGADKPNL